jgi:plastocyanin
VPATFSVVSDTQLTATVPAGATTGKIVVTTPAGAAASSITDFVVGTGGGGGGGGGPVTVGDTAFTPAALTTSQGTSVGWSFTGSATHTVSDSSGMGLFDSGTRSPGSSYAFRFAGAGSYAYSDKLHPTMTGRITVPVTASPASGGKTTAFTVRWGSAAAPAGYVYDVQVRKPGTAVFANWLLGRSSASASFTANAGAGTYTFQARLRRTSNAKFSGWSPAASISVTSTPVTARRYLTLLIGRSQWVTPDSSCSPLPDTVPLDQVAAALQARGLAATGAVVVNRINDNVQRCAADALYPTWQQLAMLRDSYRWTFVSAGIDYVSMPQLTAAQQQQNSCGSLPALQAHGHTNAWGLFAYPNNLYTSAMQANIVSKCFSYGRTYGSGLNCRTCMAPPWFKSTNSFSGGPCNNANLDCYFFTSGSGATRRYASPVTLGAAMSVPNDSWVVVQGYRFVTGSYSSSTYSWDCTDADWQNHWTSNSELYCWSDYLAAISQIPAGVVVTDPATVARAWGRALG